MLVRPTISFARKIDPLGMSEFVAHEVQIPMSGGAKGRQARHFVQGHRALDAQVAGTSVHAVIDRVVGQGEEKGFSAHHGLVVTFEVADGSFVTPTPR